LYRREAGDLGQLSLLARRRVRVVVVPVPQRRARPLLEAVRRLLAVPDRSRQRELAPDAVLADGAQRTTAKLLSLDVMRLTETRNNIITLAKSRTWISSTINVLVRDQSNILLVHYWRI